jgi:cell division protein FtsX
MNRLHLYQSVILSTYRLMDEPIMTNLLTFSLSILALLATGTFGFWRYLKVMDDMWDTQRQG